MKKKRYLLDTSICVFFLRNKYNIENKLISIGHSNCCISEITVAELMFGAVWSGCPENIRITQQFCNDIEVVPIYDSLMTYARLKTSLRQQGLSIDDFDLLIGCCAISNDMILVTDNEKHFRRLPVKIENWIQR